MKKHLGLFLLLFLFSCQLVVDVDVPFPKASITVNSFFSPDSLWSAHLSVNRHVLDQQPFQEVTNARVIIYDESQPVDTLIYRGNGLYRSDTGKPTKGKTYTISVDAENFETVSSRSVVPFPAEMEDVDLSETSINNEVHKVVKFSLQDDGHENNYYQVSWTRPLNTFKTAKLELLEQDI
jgi:hypothetical protein